MIHNDQLLSGPKIQSRRDREQKITKIIAETGWRKDSVEQTLSGAGTTSRAVQ